MSYPVDHARLAAGISIAFTTYRGADFSSVVNPLRCTVPIKYPEPGTLTILALAGSKKDGVQRTIAENPYTGGHVVVILLAGMLTKTSELLLRAYPGLKFFNCSELLVYADGWPRVVPSHLHVMRDRGDIERAMFDSGMRLKDVKSLPFIRQGDVTARFLGAALGDVVAFIEDTYLLFDKVRHMRVVVADGFIGGEAGGDGGAGNEDVVEE